MIRRVIAILTLMIAVILPLHLADATPPPSPGIRAGQTNCDLQHLGSQGHQVTLSAGTGVVRFVWTDLLIPPDSITFPGIHFWTRFNAWDAEAGVWRPNPEGCDVNQQGAGGSDLPDFYSHINIDIGSDGHEVMAEIEEFRVLQLPTHTWIHRSGLSTFGCLNLNHWPPSGGLADPIFPKISVDQGTGARMKSQQDDVWHVAAADTSSSVSGVYYLAYWRFADSVWSSSVLIDSSRTPSQVVVADPTTDEVAFVFARPLDYSSQSESDNDIAVYKSADNGLSWVSSGTGGPVARIDVTDYATTLDGRAYTDLAAIYDNGGVLHVIWNERRFFPPDSHFVGQCQLMHWDDVTQAKRPIARGFWDNAGDNGAYSMNLCKMTTGVGNGWTTCSNDTINPTNENYLYITYTRFGGPTSAEQNDMSATGYMNGETYLSISTDGGWTWSPPRNLTNTQTPGCDPSTGDSCASEHWASIAKTVDDTIHISYILDRDAGAAPLGEGTWTYNPVMYYRIPGGPDGALCAEIGAVFEGLLDQTTPGSTTALEHSQARTLTIENLGNAGLTGDVTVVYTSPPNPPAQWLSIGGAQTQNYMVSAGAAATSWGTVASNNGLDTAASYVAEIRITHNDGQKPSPQVITVQFGGPPPCICPSQADLDTTGFVDSIDIATEIDVVFFGSPDPQDPDCPVSRGDFDANEFTDSVDLSIIIDHVFFGGSPPVDPCVL